MSTGKKPTIAEWEAAAKKECKSDSLDRFTWETPEGITVKPLYTAADLEKLETLGTLPGLPPYTRGPMATMYAGVITSYSIHYTKLYDGNSRSHLPAQSPVRRGMHP